MAPEKLGEWKVLWHVCMNCEEKREDCRCPLGYAEEEVFVQAPAPACTSFGPPEKQTGPRGLLVYVAGPMRQGDQRENLWRGIQAAERLLRAGHVPYLPHLNALWDQVFPRRGEEWIAALDLPWLRLCDAVVRLPGESAGADIEVAEAVRRGIPVYAGVEDLIHG